MSGSGRTGSFEVATEGLEGALGVVLFSKLNSGQFPQKDEVVARITNQINSGVADGAACSTTS